MSDVIIIGAGTAGLTAAIYARRAGMEVTVFESDSYGGQIINTPEIENYPGIKNISGFEFATGLYEQAAALGARVEFDKISSVEGDFDSGFKVKGEYGTEETGKCLIIAAGAKNRHLGIAGEEKFEGRGISYCATCDGTFYKGKTVAVIGGGNTALEDALYLSDLCEKVYIVHRRDEYRADASLSGRLVSRENIEQVLSYVVKDLKGEDRISGVVLESRKDGSLREIEVDGIFVAVGQVPSSGVFADLVETDPSGYIVSSEDCLTNVKGIFCAGDIRTKRVRQLTTAASDGAVAALAACELIRNNN
ncbi:MAG TPA: thioredoxin-disulfide reductase [Clostridiales bacterium]|nr:thioredoxin-disulfide reductase [Clostridiales bacterium]